MINENHEIDSVAQNTNPESKNTENNRADSCPPGWTVNARGQLVWDEAAAAARKLQREKAEALANTSEAFEQWIDTATKGLRFSPDRKKAGRELRDHYEDRLEVFLDRGLPRDKAEQLAVDALGDPQETGVLLRAVHKPWLGWTLRLSRILLVLLLLGILLSWRSYSGQELVNYVEKLIQPETMEYPVEDNEILACREGRAAEGSQFGAFRVKVESARQIMPRINLEYQGKRVCLPLTRYLLVCLRFERAPWEYPQLNALLEHLSITDNHGRVWTHDGGSGKGYLLQDNNKNEVLLLLEIDKEAIDMEIDWVELLFEQLGENCSIRVSFSPWREMNLEDFEALGSEDTQLIKRERERLPLLSGDCWTCVSSRSFRAEGDTQSEWLSVSDVQLNRYISAEGDSDCQYIECVALFRGKIWERPIHGDFSSRVHLSVREEALELHRKEFSTGDFTDAQCVILTAEYEGEVDELRLVYDSPEGPVTLRLIPEKGEEP